MVQGPYSDSREVRPPLAAIEAMSTPSAAWCPDGTVSFAELVDVIVASKKIEPGPASPSLRGRASHGIRPGRAAGSTCSTRVLCQVARRSIHVPEGGLALDMKYISCHCPACHGHTYEEIVAMTPARRRSLARTTWALKRDPENKACDS